MAKIQIIVGEKRKVEEVEAWPFLPGIYAHQDFGVADSKYSLTHVESSLSIITGIEEVDLELVRSILGKLLWEKPADVIFEDDRYYKAIKEASTVLTNQQRSERQEKRISKDLDGKRQPASGSRWGYKRDVITPRFMIEAKTTKGSKMSVSFKDLSFIRRQAYATGKVPVYLVSLMDTSEVAILPDQDVGEEDLPEKTIYKNMTCQPTAKSLPVTLELVKSCLRGEVVRVGHAKEKFIIMGYETFLEFAKKGVD